MALTDEQKKKAARWLVQEMFKIPRRVAVAHRGDLYDAIDAVEDWIGAAPGGGATNAASLAAAVPTVYKTKLDTVGITAADAVALTLAAVALVRADKL